MIIKKFPLILFVVIYAIGIIIAENISTYKFYYLFIFSVTVLIIGIISEKLLRRNNILKTIIILSITLLISTSLNSVRLNKKSENNREEIRTEILVTKSYFSNSRYQNCIVKNLSNSQKYLALIPLVDSSAYKIGESLFVDAKIEELNQIEIPYNFNFARYLKQKGINEKLIVSLVYKTNISHFTSQYISSGLEGKIDNSQLNENSKALLKALVLGNKDDISDEVINSFSDSGIMHLLALSGLHIGILTWLLSFVLKPIKFLKRGDLIRSLTIVVLLWIYAYITGFSSSIIRATIMFSIIVFGHGLRRQTNIYNSLSIAAFVLLLLNPNNIFDVGFQLSFSAVIGIVWIYPMLRKLWLPKTKFTKYFWDLLLVSFAAQIATAPFTLFYFHKFSALFFVANIIEIPTITILLITSYIYIVLLFLGVEINFLSVFYNKTVMLIEAVSKYISSFDNLIFDNIHLFKWQVFLFFLIIFSILLFFQRKEVKYLFSALVFVVSAQIFFIYSMHIVANTEGMMLSKNEIFIHKNNSAISNVNGDESEFANYIAINRLTRKDTVIDNIFLFNNTLFLNICSDIDKNPITNKHVIILGKTNSNPNNIINSNTDLVVSTVYSNSNIRKRWEYFCKKNEIEFHNARDSLFYIINYTN